jgi:hypothetical protein
VFRGHGTYEAANGTTKVPQGTCVAFYCKHDGTIGDNLGQAVETGKAQPYEVFGPGAEIPNYTLSPGIGLKIFGNTITVQRPTLLSDLLKPNMGRVHWAACRVCVRNGNRRASVVGLVGRAVRLTGGVLGEGGNALLPWWWEGTPMSSSRSDYRSQPRTQSTSVTALFPDALPWLSFWMVR